MGQKQVYLCLYLLVCEPLVYGDWLGFWCHMRGTQSWKGKPVVVMVFSPATKLQIFTFIFIQTIAVAIPP